MKNIHVIATRLPSKLFISSKDGELKLIGTTDHFVGTKQHIYITSDENIKENDWVLDSINNIFQIKDSAKDFLIYVQSLAKKIILTTNQNLIANGVQPIDDDFLVWFVKNPDCEEVKVVIMNEGYNKSEDYPFQQVYKILIPKEEHKQKYTGDHFRHCYQGEYKGSCKYGDANCPLSPEKIMFELEQKLDIPSVQRWHNSKLKQTDEAGRPMTFWGGLKEPKQEPLEEVAERMFKQFQIENPIVPTNNIRPFKLGFIKGAKWQQERNHNIENLNHLQWIYDRMVEVHRENPKYDYMIKFREIINQLKKK